VSLAIAAGALAVWVTWTAPDTVTLKTEPPVVAAPAQHPGRVLGGPPGVAVQPVSNPTPPVRIAIPALGVSAQVLAEPLGAGGTLEIPPPAEVGWYEAGPAPGQTGTTLIAGHIDYDGVNGAFLSLSDLPVGATVTLTTASGGSFAYQVTRRLLLPQSNLAASGLLRDTGPPSLVLMSCGGTFVPAEEGYADNVIVVATPVPGAP